MIDIASLVANSITANLAINPQIKSILHNDMTLPDFVDTMTLWVNTDHFWRHMSIGFLTFINANYCEDCDQLIFHGEGEVENWKRWRCGCKNKAPKRGKPQRVASLKRAK